MKHIVYRGSKGIGCIDLRHLPGDCGTALITMEALPNVTLTRRDSLCFAEYLCDAVISNSRYRVEDIKDNRKFIALLDKVPVLRSALNRVGFRKIRGADHYLLTVTPLGYRKLLEIYKGLV